METYSVNNLSEKNAIKCKKGHLLLSQVFPSSASLYPVLHSQIKSSSPFFVQVWAHPPLVALSHGWTVRRKKKVYFSGSDVCVCKGTLDIFIKQITLKHLIQPNN